MAEEIVQIKRYPNRRFYDLRASKYISQEDIERLVVEGHKVEIRDSQSGEEITRAILTRIIMDRQPEKMLLFPTDMLHFILRANDVSTGFLRDYFQHSLTYLDYLSRHSTAASTITKPMHWVKAWLDSMTSPRNEDADIESAEDAAKTKETLELVERIQHLEQRLQQLEKLTE